MRGRGRVHTGSQMGSPGNLQQQEIFIKDFKGGRKCTKGGAENAPLKLNNRKAGVRILIEKVGEEKISQLCINQ